jgi:type II secretory pathway pseudopilin PulG
MPTDRALVAVRPGPRTATTPTGPHRPARGDGGLSVIEVMVAIAVIGTVMTAMAPFLARSMVVVAQQRSEQVAVEIANDALERARALKPSSLLAGRGEQRTRTQWDTAAAPVAAYLSTMNQEWDPADPTAGAQAPLPTAPQSVTVSRTTYEQHWYVGRCWQPKAGLTGSTAVVGACTAPASPAPTDIPYFRVVVAVTWSAGEAYSGGSCVRGRCIYVATTLVSTGADPTFDLKRPPPTITNAGDQIGYVGLAVNLPLTASGGTLPRVWSATGLPPGLSIAPGSSAVTGTPTTTGPYTPTVMVTDRENQTDDLTFTWTIAANPALAAPADQTSRVGTAVSLPVTVTGGHQPMAWSATGLPAGLLIDPSTGVISGNPTTEQQTTQPVTVTAVDRGKQSTSVTFGWRVLTPVRVTDPGPQTFASGSVVNTALPVSGGLGPYTWQASVLPDGLAMDTAGRITGTVANGTRYITTIVVTDSAGGKASVTVVSTVTPRIGELRVTSPAPGTADQTTTRVGAAVAVTTGATAGTGFGYTWSATGLPAGVTITSGGAFTGTPTTPGKNLVTLTVRDSSGKRANLMFIWTVTP